MIGKYHIASLLSLYFGDNMFLFHRLKITSTPEGLIRLEIDSCAPNDSGAYKLAITNEHGKKVALCAVAVTRKYFSN